MRTFASLSMDSIENQIIREFEAASDFGVSVSFSLMSLLAVASLFGFILHKLRD